jgi:hypothetical protein
MKFKNIIYAGFIFGIVLFAGSCVKQDFSEPQSQMNDTSLFKPVMSIADLIHLNPSGGLLLLDTNVYIKATVIGNDESGNYYKQLIVQDSTGGMEIDIRAASQYLRYQIGQLVYIKCKGLYLGTYGGVYKMGADYNGGIGQIPEPLIKNYIFTSPGGKPIKPHVKLMSNITTLDYNTLVKFKNVEFKNSELGKTYADYKNKVTSDVYITDVNKSTADIRTSGYADFAADSIPKGSGDITVVYSVYNGTPQLYIRSTDDVHFKQSRFGAWFDTDFSNGISSFSQYSVTGDQTWSYNSTYKCMLMSGFTTTNIENDDWLISPSLNFTNLSSAVLSFVHACSLYYSSWNMLSVKVSTNYVSGDPSSATWTDLTGYTKPTSFVFTNSNNLDISTIAAHQNNVHIAFRYTSNTSAAAKWEISSVSVDAH